MFVKNILMSMCAPYLALYQVTNNEKGIVELVQILIKIQPELIVLEATGGMEINAAIKLTEAGERCSSH